MIINIFYFLTSFIYNFSRTVTKINIKEIVSSSTKNSYTPETRVLFLIILIIVNSNLYIYALLNSKSIRFKDWMIDVMTGYKVLNEFGRCSLFILHGRFYKTRKSTSSLNNLTSRNLTT